MNGGSNNAYYCKSDKLYFQEFANEIIHFDAKRQIATLNICF